jgi:hypothetical protein
MLLAAGFAVLASAGGAAAQVNQSTYTDLDLDQCLVMQADDFGASWACPGYRGYPVRIAEGDQRYFVSYGFGAEDQPAASQAVGPNNTLGPTIEWRLENVGGDWRPFATIVRFHVEAVENPEALEGGEGGDVLVVTQLGDEPGTQCHIAWVDARLNADANELAREAADTLAGDFRCGDSMPRIMGEEFRAFGIE